MSVLVPGGGSILAGYAAWTLGLVAVAIIVAIAALVSIWMGHHSTPAKVIWTGVVLVIPIFGAVGWFMLGRERRRRGP